MAMFNSNNRRDFVQLTKAERLEAMELGSEMYESSQARGLKDYRKFKRDGVDGERVQQLGSMAERAVAKALDIEWTGWIDTFKKADLHHNVEVRLIGVDHYALRVYDRDEDSRRVVGVVIPKGREMGQYRLPGWTFACNGKLPDLKMDPLKRNHSFYGVTQDRLLPIEELRDLIELEKQMDGKKLTPEYYQSTIVSPVLSVPRDVWDAKLKEFDDLYEKLDTKIATG